MKKKEKLNNKYIALYSVILVILRVVEWWFQVAFSLKTLKYLVLIKSTPNCYKSIVSSIPAISLFVPLIVNKTLPPPCPSQLYSFYCFTLLYLTSSSTIPVSPLARLPSYTVCWYWWCLPVLGMAEIASEKTESRNFIYILILIRTCNNKSTSI